MAEDGDDGMHGIETSINCKQKLISEAVPFQFFLEPAHFNMHTCLV